MVKWVMPGVGSRGQKREISPGGLNAVKRVVRVRLTGRRWDDLGKRMAASILVLPNRSDCRDDLENIGFRGLLKPER